MGIKATYHSVLSYCDRKRSNKIREIAEKQKLDFRPRAAQIDLEQYRSFNLFYPRPLKLRYSNIVTLPEPDSSFYLAFDLAYAPKVAGKPVGRMVNSVFFYHSTKVRFKRCSLTFPYRDSKPGEKIRTIPLRWRYPGYNLQAVHFQDEDEELQNKLVRVLEAQSMILCVESMGNEFIFYSPEEPIAPEELMQILKLGPLFKGILAEQQ